MAGDKIDSTSEAWEEGALGREEEFVIASAEEINDQLDEALEMQMISIRLQKSLIDDFKTIATFHNNIGYQTLMRQVLRRFAISESKRILREIAEDRQASNRTDKPGSSRGNPRGREAAA